MMSLKTSSKLLVIFFSFRPVLWCLFKSATTQKHSRHSTDTVLEFHAEEPQAFASSRLAQVPSVAAIERASNPRPSGRKASTLPMHHHVPHYIYMLTINWSKYTTLSDMRRQIYS